MGGPPKSILAISDLTLGGSTDRADVPIGNAQQSLLQQRDRWFESGSLQRGVSSKFPDISPLYADLSDRYSPSHDRKVEQREVAFAAPPAEAGPDLPRHLSA